ncbi:pregnancy-specific glycoprotein 22-like [Peromyscus eremicus]|uniref:pregnancy-specific glycoprotein 22-like n=1 Tax=Peromyscus eremicus TaxID=42410 RepID=UPI0027DE32CB|nr:pregnancy-specific glycoprotein 22-like [Peromyscus eremicus]
MAHVTIESLPVQVTEGENVLFVVHDLPENLTTFAWFKGPTNMTQRIAMCTMDNNLNGPGHVHIGRETIYCNGSLLLENVNQKDTENYTLQTYNRHGKIVSTTSMYLHVSAFLWKCGRLGTSTKITIESMPPRVTEGRSALLLVHNLPENIESFFWFKGVIGVKNLLVIRHIPDRKSTKWGPAYTGRETLYSDGSLLLRGVTQKDHGLYFLQILRRDDALEEAEVQLQVDTSLSLFCNPLTSSQLMIQVVPRYPAEGEGVLLQVHNLPEDLLNFVWYKSKYGTLIPKTVEYDRARNSTMWWPAHRGMVYNNGSLMLQNVTEKDAGMYTLEVSKNDSKIEKASVELYVKKNVTQPFVQITDTTVTGHRSVIFTCISPDTDIFIHWFFNNKSLKLTERMTMSPTKCGLKIDPIKREDAGEYKSSILICWHLSTTDDFTMEPVPPHVANGDNVLLLVHNLPENLIAFAWIKGEISMNHIIAICIPNKKLSVPGRLYSGREKVYGNGSLLLQNVNEKDTGIYILQTFNRRTNTVSQTSMYLYVHKIKARTQQSAESGVYWNPKRNSKTVITKPESGDAGSAGEEVRQASPQHQHCKCEQGSDGKYVSQPFVQITDTTVAGSRSVTFTCISPDTDISIRWIFNNQNLKLTKRMTLSPTKCGLKIDPFKSEDAGEYKCEVSNRFSLETSLPVSWPR